MHTGLLLFSFSLLLFLALTLCYFLNLTLSLSNVNVVSLCAWSTGPFISRKVPWPSPQLIQGAMHAGSQEAARAALEHAVIGSLRIFCVCLCVCVYCVLMCTLVFLGLQTHRQPVLANGICGKTFKWYNHLIENTPWHGGKGVASSNHNVMLIKRSNLSCLICKSVVAVAF